jgi:hypothetical protein
LLAVHAEQTKVANSKGKLRLTVMDTSEFTVIKSWGLGRSGQSLFFPSSLSRPRHDYTREPRDRHAKGPATDGAALNIQQYPPRAVKFELRRSDQ